jgi:hypothetical protein
MEDLHQKADSLRRFSISLKEEFITRNLDALGLRVEDACLCEQEFVRDGQIGLRVWVEPKPVFDR